MPSYLVQTGGGSAVPFLTRLQARLPQGFAERPDVTLKNLGPASDDSSDARVVAVFDGTDPDALRLLTAAVAELRNAAFALADGPPVTRPLLTADPHGIEGLKRLIPDLPGSTDSVEGDDPFPVLEEIFASEGSGLAFPEERYAGVAAKAYAHIVKVLGNEPRLDRGNAILPGRIRTIPRPRQIRAKDWDPVVEHLESEVLYFSFTRVWLGDAGHLAMLNDRTTDLNFAFLDQLAGDYLGLKGSNEVTLVFDRMWTLALWAAGKLGGPAAKATSLMKVLWTATAKMLPDPAAVIRARIDRVKDELTKVWAAQLSVLGKKHARINSDWGLLERFGQLVSTGKLHWPEDFDPIRRAVTVAFQVYALKLLLRESNAGATMVIRKEVPCPSVRAADGWWIEACNPAGSRNCYYNWALKSKTHKSGEWCFTHFLGYRNHDPLSRSTSYLHANQNIQRKLFGSDVSSVLDPEFGFPSSFLTNPNSAERNGWGLDQTTL
jgi:hypothetical protein